MLLVKGYVFGVALLLLANGILAHPEGSRVDAEEIDTLSEDGTLITKTAKLIKNTVTEAVGALTGGGNLMTKTLKAVSDIEQKMKKAIEDGDRMIKKLANTISAVGYDKVNVTKEAVEKYIAVKTGLRSTRIELHELGYRTVAACEDMKVYLEGWNDGYPTDDQKEYLKAQFSIMKDILVETDTKLTNARALFKRAVDDLGVVETNLVFFKIEMNKKVKELDNEQRESGNDVHPGIASGCAAAIIGSIIADIFGCFGLCTATVATTCVTAGVTIGINSGVVSSELHELKNTVQAAIDDVDEILKDNKILLEYIEEEEKAVARWAAAADILGDNIKRAEKPEFKWLPLMRTVFEKSLTRLEVAAKEYINRPDWSDETEQQFLNSLQTSTAND